MFENYPSIQNDPIINLMKLFHQDTRPYKIELGIGVYKNDAGVTPIMDVVKQAQKILQGAQISKTYQGLSGNAKFNKATLKLIFGGSEMLSRSSCIQTPGSSGALRGFTELIKDINPNGSIWLPFQTFPNHAAIISKVGLKIKYYPYLTSDLCKIDELRMYEALSNTNKNDIVLIHGCCHNPSGMDLSLSQWLRLADICNKKGLIPLIDLAYQGLGENLQDDIAGLRLMCQNISNAFISVSFSKNMGLYCERTGAAIVLAPDSIKAEKVLKYLIHNASCSYAMPPDHGAALAAEILSDPILFKQWTVELQKMREVLSERRRYLIGALNKYDFHDFDYINNHYGLFSSIKINNEQLLRLKKDYAVYIVEGGRINIGGLNVTQCDYLANALINVTT